MHTDTARPNRFDAMLIHSLSLSPAQVIVDVSGGCGAKFELYISSAKFDGMKTLDRHRTINGLLTSSGLMARIHAVTLKLWTPTEFEKNAAEGKVPAAATQ